MAFIGDRAKALLYDSKLTTTFKHKLWPYAYQTAMILDNMMIREDEKNSYELFGIKAPVKPEDLAEWGRTGIVQKSHRQTKGETKGDKMLFVEYADEHSSGTYNMYNPEFGHVVVTRDTKWLD